MSTQIPMIGKTFTELTVLERHPGDISLGQYFKCICSCGKFRIVRGDRLRYGLVKHCEDCSRTIRFANSSTEYYKKTRDAVGRTRYLWKTLIQRCTNPNNSSYKNYGGRNVTIDDPRWFIYEEFIYDMGEAPEGFQIDRIDNDKGYCKENCRWTTSLVNNNNRRPETKPRRRRNNSVNEVVLV